MSKLRIPPLLVLAVLLGWCVYAPQASGYSVPIHELLVTLSFEADQAWMSRTIELPAQEDLDAFRRHLYRLASEHPNEALRQRFLKRYPAETDFDAWAMKEFLAFHGAARVIGIDVPPTSTVHGESIAKASAHPDEDLRNIGRLAYREDGGRRTPLQDRHGRPVPFDPALLNMGRLDELSSQAHAHYGLPQIEFSEDVEVLETDPRRFAIAIGFPDGPVLTLASEMAQIHTDLAILAALSGQPHGLELGWLWGAQGWHYTEDVGNQIHTVQVGLYEFFESAQLEYWQRAALTFGGLLGDLESFPAIGIRILQNHHLLSEDLTSKRVVDLRAGKAGPRALRQALQAAAVDDSDFLEQFQQRDPGAAGEFALELTRTLIEISSHEGPEVYRLTRALAKSRFSSYGVLFDSPNEDPDTALRDGAEESEEALKFYTLQGKAFRRVTTALRAWRFRFEAAITRGQGDPSFSNTVMERLMARQLNLLDQSEARRDQYLANPPEPLSGRHLDWGFLLGSGAIVLGGLFFIAGFFRRRRRIK